MNIEQKAKAYDDALKRAKDWATEREQLICPREIVESIFPQLSESEDERVRKRAIAILKHQRDYWSYDGPMEKCPPATPLKDLVDAIDVALSYLEKQKESLHISETCKENADSFTDIKNINIRGCIGMALADIPESRFKAYGVTLKDCLAYVEKQKELDKMIVVSPEVWDNAISDAFENGKKEDAMQKEQKPIKGGDIITKDTDRHHRVFMVLGTVDERNYNEEHSRYCESLLLGVDGNVCCDNTDLKGFRIANIEERAQFLHDFKCSVSVKQKPAEIDEYEIIKKHITEDSLSSEVNKRLKECGWYVTEDKSINNSTREKIISRATSEKQVVLVSESSGNAEIGWDTRSLEDAKKLLEYGLAFINKNGINPAEKQDYSGLNDLERAIHRGFLSAGVENVPVTIIKETAKECLALKPVEWLEEDEVYLQDALWCVEQAIKVARDENDMGACWSAERWLKSLKPKLKAEWSEEDELMRTAVIQTLERFGGRGTTGMQIEWLKSLPERFNLQPKQEWSEEDKELFGLLHQCVCRCINDPNWEYQKRENVSKKIIPFIERLKSLRPQPHWRPSEEQMRALGNCVLGRTPDADARITLEILWDNLQKLF